MPALMEKFRQERLSIAEEVAAICKDTQAFLSDSKTKRLKQAEEQAVFLRQFHEKVQQENRVFFNSDSKTASISSKKTSRFSAPISQKSATRKSSVFNSYPKTTFNPSETAKRRFASVS